MCRVGLLQPESRSNCKEVFVIRVSGSGGYGRNLPMSDGVSRLKLPLISRSNCDQRPQMFFMCAFFHTLTEEKVKIIASSVTTGHTLSIGSCGKVKPNAFRYKRLGE